MTPFAEFACERGANAAGWISIDQASLPQARVRSAPAPFEVKEIVNRSTGAAAVEVRPGPPSRARQATQR